MQSDKLVYLGIDLGPRSRAVGLTGKVVPDVARREFAALQQRVSDLDDLMEGPGVAAQPAFDNDMAWLLARSFAFGCPVPEPDADADGVTEWASTDLHEFTGSTFWSAEPLAQSTRIESTMGERPINRHVVVLTV